MVLLKGPVGGLRARSGSREFHGVDNCHCDLRELIGASNRLCMLYEHHLSHLVSLTPACDEFAALRSPFYK